MSYHFRQTIGPPQPITFRCPICQGEPAGGTVWQIFEQAYLLHLIPVGGRRQTTWVKCTGCSETFPSRRPLDDLQRLPPHQVGDWLVLRATLPAQLLAALSVTLFWLPMVGLMIAGAAWVLNRKSHTWTARTSRIGLGLAVIANVLIIVLIVVGEALVGRR